MPPPRPAALASAARLSSFPGGARPRLALAALALLALGCASPPRWVRRTPGLRLLYRPRTIPYLEDPRFVFEVSRKWRGPEPVPGGVRYRSPGGAAEFSIAFAAKGSEGWLEPEQYRKRMGELGSVEDSHVVLKVELSSRTAHRVLYTSYEYDAERLLGENVEVRAAELWMLPDEEGLYLIRYEAPRSQFERWRRHFRDFLGTLALAPPKPKEE